MTATRAGAHASPLLLTLLLPLLVAAASCGDGTVSFGGKDDDVQAKVTFEGNLDSISPVTSRDIVVFVYQIEDDHSDRCPCPRNPCDEFGSCDNLIGKTQILSAGETEFSISGLEPGTFGVVFLLDEAGDNADGQIDPGDEIAVLDDPDCEIDDVNGNITVTLTDVDLDFTEQDVQPEECTTGNPPADGRARADQIRKKTTDTTTKKN